MFFPEDEKPMRLAALKSLLDMVDDEKGKKVGMMRKPIAASMTIEKVPSSDIEDKLKGALGGDGDDDEDDELESLLHGGKDDDQDDDEPSDDEKAEIARKYHKYCYGGKV